jgi:transcription elongation factor GreA
MKKAYQLTAGGKLDLEKELAELKARRPEIAQKIAEARNFGDLTENDEHTQARNEQAQVESRIAEVENILQNATIIKAKSTASVQVGCTVELKNGDSSKTMEYTIVGSVEADPLEGKISNESPIGVALMGKKVSDTVTIHTPSGEASYKIVAIK